MYLTAAKASLRYPLDSNTVTDFGAGYFRSRTELYDLSNTFVATDLTWLSRKGEPLPLFDMSVT